MSCALLLQTSFKWHLLLASWGRLEEAMKYHKIQETLCEELGNKILAECDIMDFKREANKIKEWIRKFLDS